MLAAQISFQGLRGLLIGKLRAPDVRGCDDMR